jgi:hypothetical protein
MGSASLVQGLLNLGAVTEMDLAVSQVLDGLVALARH